MLTMSERCTDLNLKEQQLNRSVLLDEVKKKLQLLQDSGLSVSYIASLLYVEKPLVKLAISRNFRIYLGDERNEVRLEPIVKAVYLLFLNHPEGISFKSLLDYRDELIGIYMKLKPYGLTGRAKRSIEDVINPLSNSINEKCSRIKAAFLAEVDDTIVEQYIITGERGEPKRITLPRELVEWE